MVLLRRANSNRLKRSIGVHPMNAEFRHRPFGQPRASRRSAERGDDHTDGAEREQARAGERRRRAPARREASIDADPRRGDAEELVHEQVAPGRKGEAGKDDELATGHVLGSRQRIGGLDRRR